MTALIPDNCWKSMSPREMDNGLILFPLNNSKSGLWVACLSLSTWVFSTAASSSLTSAFLPRSHSRDLRARFVLPLEMYHLGVSGMRNISSRNGNGKQAPSNARFDQSRYIPATKHTKIPVINHFSISLLFINNSYIYIGFEIRVRSFKIFQEPLQFHEINLAKCFLTDISKGRW